MFRRKHVTGALVRLVRRKTKRKISVNSGLNMTNSCGFKSDRIPYKNPRPSSPQKALMCVSRWLQIGSPQNTLNSLENRQRRPTLKKKKRCPFQAFRLGWLLLVFLGFAGSPLVSLAFHISGCPLVWGIEAMVLVEGK